MQGARGCGCYTHALGYALLRTLNRYIVHISWYVICISCGRSDARCGGAYRERVSGDVVWTFERVFWAGGLGTY